MIDGNSHVGWHSDNEEDLFPNASICDLSLGATRSLEFRHKSESELGKLQSEIRRKMKGGYEKKTKIKEKRRKK